MAIPSFLRRRDPGVSVQQVAIRTAAFAVACAWALWQIESLVSWISNPNGTFTWHVITTAVIFATSNLILFVAFFTGNPQFIIVALRQAGLTLPLVFALLLLRPPGAPELWYAGFIGVPAVAFALTVPMRQGISFFIVMVGGLSFINALYSTRGLFIDVAANVGFSLVNTFAFIILAATTVRVAAVTDASEEQSREASLSAARIRARTEELEGFTSLLHDHILSGLSAISHGLRPVNPVDGIEELNYDTDAPELSPAPEDDNHARFATTSPYQLMGMNVVYSWQFAVFISVVLLLVMLASGRLPSFAGLLAYLILVALLPVLMVGRASRLSSVRAVVLTSGLVAVAIIGLWQTPPLFSSWALYWQINVIALFASLLAIRGRPGWAVTAIVISACGIDTVRMLGIAPDSGITAMTVISYSIIVVAAALVNLSFTYLLSKQPAAIEARRRAEAEKAAAEEAANQRTYKLQLLDAEVRPVFDAARHTDPISGPLRIRARLTELWLRDLVRSPLLNLPSIRESVRGARLRGATVQLLDDHSHAVVLDREATEAAQQAVWEMRGIIIEAIDSADPDASVTVRVLPPGRRGFLTVTCDNGSSRYDRQGERL